MPTTTLVRVMATLAIVTDDPPTYDQVGAMAREAVAHMVSDEGDRDMTALVGEHEEDTMTFRVASLTDVGEEVIRLPYYVVFLGPDGDTFLTEDEARALPLAGKGIRIDEWLEEGGAHVHLSDDDSFALEEVGNIEVVFPGGQIMRAEMP